MNANTAFGLCYDSTPMSQQRTFVASYIMFRCFDTATVAEPAPNYYLFYAPIAQSIVVIGPSLLLSLFRELRGQTPDDLGGSRHIIPSIVVIP